MRYRNSGRNEDLLHDIAVGTFWAWVAGLFVNGLIGWWDRREAAKYRRQRLEQSRPPVPRPSRMWWDEGTLPVGTPRPDAPGVPRSLMWWDEQDRGKR